jgi:hypothetical protein
LALNWHLQRANYLLGILPDDFTVAYRALDPAWIDPVLGVARTEHVVAFMNPGTAFVRIYYENANWAGAAHYLYVVSYFDRAF